MKVQCVNASNYKFSFGRAFTKEEEALCRQTVSDAKKYLGIEELSLICHGTSYPNSKAYTGSINSKEAKEFENFINIFGFNSVQQGPNGRITPYDVSPYSSETFSRNILFIDLEELTTDKYQKILDEEIYKKLAKSKESVSSNYSYSDFNKAFNQIDDGLSSAIEKFSKLPENNPLKKEFKQFCDAPNNKEWLETSSLFHVLSRKNKTSFTDWNDIDKNLISLKKVNNQDAIARYNQLLSEHAREIELDKFSQFIAYKQIKEFQIDGGIKHIGDALLAFSHADVWANQDAFLSHRKIGCPPNTNWGFWTLNPNKIFNKDGSDAIGAKLIRQKFNHILDTNSSVRIDHIMGFINPYLFPNGQNHGGNYATLLTDVDGAEKYNDILPKIVVPLLNERGIKPEDVVAEDLCWWRDDDYNKFLRTGLSGFVKADENRAENIIETNKRGFWAVYGTHDDPPMMQKILMRKGNDSHQLDYLLGYLNPLHRPNNDPLPVEHKYQNIYNLMELKATEMFSKYKRIQVSFMDFLGINKTYNRGNTFDDTNWKLRVPDNYKKRFYDSFENSQRYSQLPSTSFLESGFCPMNILKIFRDSIIAKNDLEVAKNGGDMALKASLDKKSSEIIKNLEKLSAILKEPSVESVIKPNNIPPNVKKNKIGYFIGMAIVGVTSLFAINKYRSENNLEEISLLPKYNKSC